MKDAIFVLLDVLGVIGVLVWVALVIVGSWETTKGWAKATKQAVRDFGVRCSNFVTRWGGMSPF